MRPRSMRRVIAHLWWHRQGRRLGISIYPGAFGPGLSIAHIGSIVVNGNARIGENCRIHAGVNIGTGGGESDVPTIGNNCYIAPGAKIFGRITIGDNVAIGANAVVNRDFPQGNCTLVGVPARPTREKA